MKSFIYFSDYFERSLKKSSNAFNEVNAMDCSRNGEDFSAQKVAEILVNYTAKDTLKWGLTFNEYPMKQFVQNLQDVSYSASTLIDTKKLDGVFARFKIDNNNYGKQMMLLEIANIIWEEKTGSKLIEVLK